MQVCLQRHEVATNGKFFPSNSGSKPHRVYAFRTNEQNFCTCKSFIFGRSKIAKAEGTDQREVSYVCVHIQATYDTVCDWRQRTPSDYRYDHTCPKCGGPLVDTDAPMIPEDPNAALEDLRALRAELLGEEPPEPLQTAKPFLVSVRTSTVFHVRVDGFDEADASKKALNHLAANHDAIMGQNPVALGVDLTEITRPKVLIATETTVEPPVKGPKFRTKPASTPKTVDPSGVAAALDALAAGVKPR